jgi:arylsulfatase A-like enzyme
MLMTEQLPNILIIHADEHRADCLSVFGNKEIKTPNLEELAKDGIGYSNCFATFPVCTPSRYSFLTGLYVHQHLGWNNHSTLPQGLPTFPKILSEAGYHTKCVGKMHFTPTYLDVGFQEMILSEQDGPGRLDDDYHRYLRDKKIIDYIDLRDQDGKYRSQAADSYHNNFGTDPSILDEKHYNTTWIGDKSCEELENWNEGGHLLMIGFIKPHHPFDAPAPWSEMYNPEDLSLLPGWTDEMLKGDFKFQGRGFYNNPTLTKDSMKNIIAKYYGSISQIDFHVGRMIEILKAKGQYKNTLIIYTSDHGDFMSYHHMVTKGNYLYDPVIKVPLIVKYPESSDVEEKGIVLDGLVSIIDITATIIETAECMIPQTLWETIQPLQNEFDGEPPREIVFAEGNKNYYMARTKTRKLLYCRKAKSQFFNLEDDPNELHNLIDESAYKDEINEIKDKLLHWIAFESRSPVHLDEDAPIIDRENVLPRGDGHRQDMKNYLASKMKDIEEKKK